MTWIFKISSAHLQGIASGYQGSLCPSSSTIKEKVEKLCPRDQHFHQSVSPNYSILSGHFYFIYWDYTSFQEEFQVAGERIWRNTTSKWRCLSTEEGFPKMYTFLLIILDYTIASLQKTVLRRNQLQK